MSVYIISNREVSGKKFKNSGKEKASNSALPMFRIAKCIVEEGAEKATYEILPDSFNIDYGEIVKRIENRNNYDGVPPDLPGTGYMFYDLYTQMLEKKDDDGDILFFIHGYANSFNDNLEHIAKLKELFIDDPNSPIDHLVYLSWPTRNHKFFTYKSDQDDAFVTGQVLARLFDKLRFFFLELFEIHKAERCRNKIHLAVHSMGNQVLENMLQNLPNEKLFPLIKEVFLFHSDVEDDVFEPGKAFTKLQTFAGRTHMYIHKSDDALFISRITKNGNKRLGKRGPRDRSVLNDETFIVDVSYVKDPKSCRERLWDHWGYIELESEIQDIISVMREEDEMAIKNRELRDGEVNYFYLLDDKTDKKVIERILRKRS